MALIVQKESRVWCGVSVGGTAMEVGETVTRRAHLPCVDRMRRDRKTFTEEPESPTDSEAGLVRMEIGATNAACKPEYVVDVARPASSCRRLQPADRSVCTTVLDVVVGAAANLHASGVSTADATHSDNKRRSSPAPPWPRS